MPITDQWAGRLYSYTETAADGYDVVALDDKHPLVVQEWTDFRYDAILLANGHLLGRTVRDLHPTYRPVWRPSPDHWRRVGTIVHEGLVRCITDQWTQPIVRVPIRVAAHQLRPLLAPSSSGSISQPALMRDHMEWDIPEAKHSTLGPDWVSRALHHFLHLPPRHGLTTITHPDPGRPGLVRPNHLPRRKPTQPPPPRPRGLTANLALWALACMGMNDE